jgi:hypothetical protein
MDYNRLLLQHDDPTRWEYPPGFDYAAASAKFAQFTAELAGELGITLKAETGLHIQDASFHSQLYLPLPGDRYVLIRFSNFGDMATVSDDEAVPKALTELVAKLLARHAYTYVPAAVLHQRYTGINPGVTGISSW